MIVSYEYEIARAKEEAEVAKVKFEKGFYKFIKNVIKIAQDGMKKKMVSKDDFRVLKKRVDEFDKISSLQIQIDELKERIMKLEEVRSTPN